MRAAAMKERPSFTLMKQTDVQSIYHKSGEKLNEAGSRACQSKK